MTESRRPNVPTNEAFVYLLFLVRVVTTGAAATLGLVAVIRSTELVQEEEIVVVLPDKKLELVVVADEARIRT